jgi:protein-S-isoprenylcysteine O-methyltransferase Ste14
MKSVLAAIFFASLMLLGWGSPDFFNDGPRSIVFFGGVILSFFASGKSTGMSRGKEQGEPNFLFTLLVGLTILTAFLLPFFASRKLTVIAVPIVFRYAGAILLITSLALRVMAIRTLKKQFSIYVAIQENHQLITTGLYSRIRHPIYLGAVLSILGMELVFPTLLGFIFVAIYSMLLIHRMAREETLMLKHFGSAYEEYLSKSFRLIPKVY